MSLEMSMGNDFVAQDTDGDNELDPIDFYTCQGAQLAVKWLWVDLTWLDSIFA